MMLRQLERLRRDEEGMAMIVSLMVAFVVLMLSTIIVAQSIHSLESSGYDRQRLTSVNAAEAGTNEWWQYLQNTDWTIWIATRVPKRSARNRPRASSPPPPPSTVPTARRRCRAR